MPWSSDGNGPKASGPWGGGGGGRKPGPWGNGGGRGPGGGGGGGGGAGGPGGQGPNIEDLFKKGQSQLKTVLGDGGGGGAGFGLLIALLIAAGAWVYASVYQVRDGEQAAVLTFGEFTNLQGPGLNFAPWPVQTAEIRSTTQENTIEIGVPQSETRAGRIRSDGIMLTGDENIIDINFQIVWNISELDKFLFNLADPDSTIAAVAESAIREIVGRSRLAPLLNEGRDDLVDDVQELVQATLDEYQSGVNVIRVNLDRADPPSQVIDAFRDVQAAAQERDTLQKQAEAYFNETTARARGEAAQLREQAEAYRAQVVAEAEGQASRFEAVLEEYQNAEDVTRQRLYIETMERVYGGMNKIILDDNAEGSGGVVPYLPLNELQRSGQRATAAAQ